MADSPAACVVDVVVYDKGRARHDTIKTTPEKKTGSSLASWISKNLKIEAPVRLLPLQSG